MASLSVLMVADVSPLEPRGGAARVLRELSLGLRRRGHRVEVLCRMAHDGAPLAVELEGVPVHQYPVSRSHPVAFFFSSIVGARRAFAGRSDGPRWDVVIFNQPLSAVGLRGLLPRGTAAAYVFYSPAATEYRIRAAHRDAFHPRLGVEVACALLRWTEGVGLRGSHCVVVMSDFSRRLLLDTHGNLARPTVTIPGGADLARFCPAADRRLVRTRLGLPPEGLLLFTVRDLEPRMGIENLMEAVSLVRTELSPRLVIGGHGRLRAALEGRVAGLGLAGVVTFAGLIPEADLPRYYQAADCFVLPTRDLEGFGLVTVEALACGTPVLGTPVGATPEILAPLAPELLTDDASPEALARGIRRVAPLVGDDGFRARCRAHAERHYGWPTVVARLEQLLLELVAEPAWVRPRSTSSRA